LTDSDFLLDWAKDYTSSGCLPFDSFEDFSSKGVNLVQETNFELQIELIAHY